MGSGRDLGPCERPGGRLGSRGVLRAVQRGRAAQLALRSADDGEGADLRVWDGHLLVSEDGLEEDIAFRMLAAGNFPQHRTLCEFRHRHLKDFQAVFAEVVCLARGMGLVGFGRVSVDGTKVRANASKRKAMSYGRMVKEERRLQAEIGALLKRAEAVDEAEDARYGEDARG